MADRAAPEHRDSAPSPARGSRVKISNAATPASQALALQRAVGNRIAARVLARWAPHPDKQKKGMLMSDGAVTEYNRFNPPLSK